MFLHSYLSFHSYHLVVFNEWFVDFLPVSGAYKQAPPTSDQSSPFQSVLKSTGEVKIWVILNWIYIWSIKSYHLKVKRCVLYIGLSWQCDWCVLMLCFWECIICIISPSQAWASVTVVFVVIVVSRLSSSYCFCHEYYCLCLCSSSSSSVSYVSDLQPWLHGYQLLLFWLFFFFIFLIIINSVSCVSVLQPWLRGYQSWGLQPSTTKLTTFSFNPFIL